MGDLGLLGTFQHTIDEKNRLSIPGKFRDYLNAISLGVVVVTISAEDPCLTAYPTPEWEAKTEQIEKYSTMMNKESTQFQRIFYSNASDCSLDKQGRIIIPPPLRQHARLTKEVIIVGMKKRFEIWDRTEWERQEAYLKTNRTKIQKALAGSGI